MRGSSYDEINRLCGLRVFSESFASRVEWRLKIWDRGSVFMTDRLQELHVVIDDGQKIIDSITGRHLDRLGLRSLVDGRWMQGMVPKYLHLKYVNTASFGD